MPWRLTNITTGQSKSFADWGFQNLTKRTISQGVGTAQFRHIVRSIVTEPPLAYGNQVSILRPDGVQWFYGKVTSVPRHSSGRTENNQYTISDAFWDLERVVAQQEWPGVTPGLTTRFLFYLSDRADPPLIAAGTHISVGEQIRFMLTDAIAAGVQLRLGQVLPNDTAAHVTAQDPEAVKPPIIERLDVTYAEGIRDGLRYVPGAVSWLDYTTTPPTIHIRDVSHLDSLTVAAKDCEEISLDPQYHLVRDGVTLRYEIAQSVPDQPSLVLVTEKYPLDANEESLDGYVQTINLRGPSGTKSTGTLVVNTIALTDISWWKTIYPALTHEDVTAVAFTPGTHQGRSGTYNPPLPYCKTGGSIADWMLVGSIAGRAEQETVFASFQITSRTRDESGNLTGATATTKHLAKVSITSTDLPTDSYSSTTITSDGDPRPVGLAKALYDFWNRLQYSGTVRRKQRELTGPFSLGKKLNITGLVPAWATMGALIQSVTEDADTGETTAEVGPVNVLSVADTIDLLR